jgi:hypothetical protein
MVAQTFVVHMEQPLKILRQFALRLIDLLTLLIMTFKNRGIGTSEPKAVL